MMEVEIVIELPSPPRMLAPIFAEDSRLISWFSAGAASTVASKLALERYPDISTIAYINPGAEHPDNERYVNDVEEWLGVPIVRLSSPTYSTPIDVFLRTGYLVGPAGARCTTELKKKVRLDFSLPSDVHVFGYTSEELTRAFHFQRENPGVEIWAPLIEANLSKEACKTIIKEAGITLPTMYRLGYKNNNCIGCVKGGMGYWNKIRRDFPEVFLKMALVEKQMGRTILRDKKKPLPLTELDPSRGSYGDEPERECSPFTCGK